MLTVISDNPGTKHRGKARRLGCTFFFSRSNIFLRLTFKMLNLHRDIHHHHYFKSMGKKRCENKENVIEIEVIHTCLRTIYTPLPKKWIMIFRSLNRPISPSFWLLSQLRQNTRIKVSFTLSSRHFSSSLTLPYPMYDL